MNGTSGLSLWKLFDVIIYFRLGDGQDKERFSKIGVSLGCLYYLHTKVCSQIISGGDLCHVGPSKLICETNRWTGPCVMRFSRQSFSEQNMILHLCESGKYTTVLCFSIR